MHSIVVSPGLAKSLSWELDLWDNLRLTYTLITTNSKNRVEHHLTICHQPGHGYHIYLTSIDCLNSFHWLLDLTRTYSKRGHKDSGYIDFSAKIYFRFKSKWVKYGHKSHDPDHSTLAGSVLLESVRTALNNVTLNHIDIMTYVTKTAYIQSLSPENHYIIFGSGFVLDNVG